MDRILLTGATGFIGQALLRAWQGTGEIAVLTQSSPRATAGLGLAPERIFNDVDAAAAGFEAVAVVSACFFAAAVSAKCFSLICAARSFRFSSFCFSAVDSSLALAAEVKGAATAVRLLPPTLPPSALDTGTGLDLARSSAKRALRAAAFSCSSLSRCWLLMDVYLDAVDSLV